MRYPTRGSEHDHRRPTAPPPPLRGRDVTRRPNAGDVARQDALTADIRGTPFARCTRCNQICGVMRATNVRAGDWLALLDRSCTCGASVEDLVPAVNDKAMRGTLSDAVLPIVLVPDE